MRIARLATVLALAITAAIFAAAASAATSGSPNNPTAAQINKAITQAEKSKSLWATINICNSSRYPNTIGVRGQMPSLGFPAWLSMKIQLDYYSTASRQFVPLPGGGGTHTTRLGRSSGKLQQGGATWSFNMPVLLNATVTFVWKREGKLLGETSQTTVAGHPNAQFGSPQHYSAKQCQLP